MAPLQGSDKATAPAPAPEPARPMARWVPVALVLSLALNLLIAGIFIGSWAAGHTPRPSRAAPEARLLRDLGLGPFLNAFPKPTRRQMARALRAEIGSLAMERAALVEEVQQILTLLRADSFDADAFEAVVKRQEARINARAEAGRRAVVQAIGGMTPQERAVFADRLEDILRKAQARSQARAGKG